MWQDRKGFMGIVQRRALRTSEFFFGDRVAFSASDSGSLRKRTNQSQSLPHFVAKKKFTAAHLEREILKPSVLLL
jgi:hypothetical protein